MEKLKRAVSFISLAALILLLLYVKYAYERGAELWPAKTKLSKDEVRIERKIKIPEGETKEFIQPAFLVRLSYSSTETPEDVIEDLEKGNYGHDWYEKARLNEDGTLSMTVTGKQLEHWISTREDGINKRIVNNKNKDMEIKINEDFTEVTYILKKGYEISFLEWAIDGVVILGCLLEAQVFTGVPPEDCHVREVVKREEDGVVIIDAVTPGTNYEVTEREWYGEEQKK